MVRKTDYKIPRPFFEGEVRRHFFKGFWKNESWCWLELVRKEDYLAVVATQPGEESGSLITNMAEELATQVRERLEVLPGKLLWVEHYPAGVLKKGTPETFHRIDFRWHNGRAERPRWVQFSYEEIRIQVLKLGL